VSEKPLCRGGLGPLGAVARKERSYYIHSALLSPTDSRFITLLYIHPRGLRVTNSENLTSITHFKNFMPYIFLINIFFTIFYICCKNFPKCDTHKYFMLGQDLALKFYYRTYGRTHMFSLFTCFGNTKHYDGCCTQPKHIVRYMTFIKCCASTDSLIVWYRY
jgi:hypothetical protein